jgi:phosphate transport system ATP-binding protein
MTDSNTKLNTDDSVFDAEGVKVYYSGFLALVDVYIKIPRQKIVAFIGPSGCGKSTLLRCFNRMNDLIPGAKVEGKLIYRNRNIYDPQVNSVKLRRQVGMVFQRPNPFPKSIYENIAYAPRTNGYQGNLDELVESSLRQAAIWNEVKDKLQEKGTALSGGQQMTENLGTSPVLLGRLYIWLWQPSNHASNQFRSSHSSAFCLRV